MKDMQEEIGVFDEMGGTISEFVGDWLTTFGLSGLVLGAAQVIVLIFALVIICVISDWVTKKLIISFVERIIKKTKNTWDDKLIEKNVFGSVAHLVPAALIGLISPVLFKGHDFWVITADKVSSVYLTIGVILTFISFFKAFQMYLASRPQLKDKPLDSYMQLVRLIAYVIGGIYIVSIIIGRSPLGVFSALGAMSVVLMLVFKDTILGFVGSIQIAANDMVKVGDWVEFPKYGADGDVVEIKLQTIKIQNWDKTITTIPTYSFVSEAFKNWRGMEESGGRRIKRALMIDLTSIFFCTPEQIEKFKGIQYIKDYIEKKQKDVEEHNLVNKIDMTNYVNGRRITNIGTFRAYVEAYLRNHPLISKEMTFMVRQLPSTEKGLPMEIYVFCTDQRWTAYEAISADIFDHLISIVKEFDLRLFQNPSGTDFRKLGEN